ncbi:5420_t:CDS:2 [Ambispora leptoticha]|uniref:5420_t:CDS:1 n=1 Tax=Ambispora leptoticha TaxID=144679 RepID=A0A9N9HXR6_9GLOM|nr:5420_t:CDS:2 [Ambispora leptoticha]
MPSKKEEKKHSKSEQENHQQKAKETNQLQTSTSRKTLRRLRNQQQIEKMSSKIAKECHRLNIKFLDREFDLSEYYSCLYNFCKVTYTSINDIKRISKLFKDAKFYADGVSPGDVQQGMKIDDCCFLSAVSTCTNISGVIETICVERDEQVGVYGFIFFKDGDWVSTIVDDQLFIWTDVENNTSTISAASCKDPNETWLPLLEKEYAKIHGDYKSIEGGTISHALEDLTGSVSTDYATSEILDTDRLWKKDFLNVNRSLLAEPDLEKTKELLDEHAYSILDATEYQGTKLVKIRNQWGKTEWAGDWSDGSELWTSESMAALNHRFGDDGIFLDLL